MDVVLLGARLLLAVVFAVAGVAKLADRAGSRKAVTDFGLPTVLANPLAIALPVAELAVAVALVPVASAWWGAVGALALLLAFIAGIAINLLRGRKPDCHCFGQLHSEPVGASTLVRNGVLAAIAGLVLWQGRDHPGPSVLALLRGLTAAQVLGIAACLTVLGLLAGLCWFVFHLFRQNGRLLLRIEALETRLGAAAPQEPAAPAPHEPLGLPMGAAASPFRLPDLAGAEVTLDGLRSRGKPVLLVFSDPGCGPCNALVPELARWQRQHQDKLTLALVSRGTPEKNRAKAAGHNLRHILLQQRSEVADAYGAHGTPGAVLVQPDGTIGSPLAMGADAIEDLIGRTTGAQEPTRRPLPSGGGNGHRNGHGNGVKVPDQPPAVTIGEPAPDIRLPDLSGSTVGLKDFRGQETLVLFWNPRCGFCQKMLGDLKSWEQSLIKGSLNLLVISTGSIEENQAMALRSPVVLDQRFAVGSTLGIGGTPSAVLVDAEGNVGSEVAVGGPAVLALAGVPQGQPRPAPA